MRQSHRDTVVLVPGLFGFGRFGKPPHAINYFDQVSARITEYTGWPQERIVVHEPPPTGALVWRVRSLYERIRTLIDEGLPSGASAGTIHLVGHSTGGCDIRLLLNEHYNWPDSPTAQERARFIARIGAVVTLSSPLQGTPIARRLRGAMEAGIPALFVLSILGKQGKQVRLRAQFTGAARMVLQTARSQSVNEGLQSLVRATLPDETVEDVTAFLDKIVVDHELIHDLTVFAMHRLNDTIAGGDRKPLRCYVSAAPAPRPTSVLLQATPLRALQSALYSFSYANTCPDPRQHPAETAPFPKGDWIDDKPPASLGLESEYASDGVVTASSQTVDGTAAGIVLGDHLDVVGHFASRRFNGVTAFRSSAGFDDERFDALWKAISADLLAAAAQAAPASSASTGRPASRRIQQVTS